MTPEEQILRLGGIARRAELNASPSDLRRAVAAGTVVRSARGRYSLPQVDAAASEAHALGGVLCLTSAALHHGWSVRLAPDRPQISLPRNRKHLPRVPHLELHRFRLHLGDIDGVATSRDRTLVDCLRHLPVADALCVADSALRDGYGPSRLRALVRDIAGPGAVRARRVACVADGRAANPFESALRAIALGVQGLTVEPQVPIVEDDTFLGRPDLVDRELRIALEADSFAWHGGSAALTHDARRYNALAVAGWLVLRFTWVDVVRNPDDVRAVLEAAVGERANRCRCDQPRPEIAA